MQDVKEYLYSQCLDWFELGNVPEHIMNITTCQRASTEAEHSTNCIPDRSKVIFNDVVTEKHPQIISWEPLTKCKVLTFGDMKKAIPSERI